MQVVIEISEEDLDCIKYLKVKGWASRHELQILNGTPLPKGHGRLIDADVLQEDCLWWETEHEVSLAPTIIEADKESEE